MLAILETRRLASYAIVQARRPRCERRLVARRLRRHECTLRPYETYNWLLQCQCAPRAFSLRILVSTKGSLINHLPHEPLNTGIGRSPTRSARPQEG